MKVNKQLSRVNNQLKTRKHLTNNLIVVIISKQQAKSKQTAGNLNKQPKK